MTQTIICGDCLEIMPSIPDKSIDLIYADPPFAIAKTFRDAKREIIYDNPKTISGLLEMMAPRLV